MSKPQDNPFCVCDPMELKLRRDIEREQVKRIPLSEYAIGSPHYEALHKAMRDAERFSLPAQFEI